MYLKKLLTKSFLVAAGLLVGTSAWADVTQVIDFKTFTASSQPAITLSETPISQSGTNALTVYQLTNAGTYFDRIALSHNNSASVQKRWMFRNGSNDWQYGLCGNWNNGGTANTSYNISVLDLYEGDRITFNYTIRSGKDAKPKFCSANIVTSGSPAANNTAETALESGTTYTMIADGNLDLYITDDNLGIYTITIVSSHVAESIDIAPSISVSGADEGNREITITSSKTNTDGATVTYYTKDGSEPTSASTLYSGAFNVTSTDATEGVVTIKAITYKDGDTSIKSEVTTYSVTGVGTIIKLANPIVKLSDMVEATGVYNPAYAFSADATGTFGSPTITLKATFNGTPIDAAGFTATATGTISVVATADGYGDSDATEVEVVGVGYEKITSIDVADFYPEASGEWPDGLDYNQIDGLTISPVNLTQGCTYRTKHNSDNYYAYYGRNKGFTVTCSGLASTQMVVIENHTKTEKYVITKANNSASIGVNGTFKYYTLYAIPVTSVTTTLDNAGYATFASEYPLDLTTAKMPAGVTAYKAAVDGKTAKFTALDQTVPANTGILLKGAANAEVTINVVASGTAVEGNAFLVNEAGTTFSAESGYYYFAMLKNAADLTFATFAPGTLAIPANKAYLKVAESNFTGGARLFVTFDEDETTGINEELRMKNEESSTAPVYNLNGQRVAQPTRGLYIVNGKKVLVP